MLKITYHALGTPSQFFVAAMLVLLYNINGAFSFHIFGDSGKD
jgi:hypothetical protein